MTKITQDRLWFQITDNSGIPKWYIQVAATHEYDREVEELRKKYGELTIMEQGYDESSRYGMFTVFGVPIADFLKVHPEEIFNFDVERRKLIPKLAEKYRRYA